MGITVYVKVFGGDIIHRGECDVRELVEAARLAHLPFLANVDVYDDTVFNRTQLAVVAEEIKELARLDLPDALLNEVIQMIEWTQERPHRYLVFNGD